MYAIIRTGGKQYRVEPGQRIQVESLKGEVGTTVELGEVLALGGDGALQIGKPTVAGAKVTAAIRAQKRDAKIIVFHKRRRKAWKKKQGHRQDITVLEIQSISPAGR